MKEVYGNYNEIPGTIEENKGILGEVKEMLKGQLSQFLEDKEKAIDQFDFEYTETEIISDDHYVSPVVRCTWRATEK